ncbi:tRNA 2-selenouridine(34) synthase MnmH [Edwardsiella ictaluri]|uniref:tRNA 2-selenouridine synthase n=2 Tax=Edwardsiella ictaluri TaxID=67780 RepID=C5B9Y2_EDWI9|nr:tRNA 2-selenouridine(34) synthase MnmH [Edwardsiella ictaluri]ACR68833.1 tRNA 2-selenouridine synthase, putative [Edwardsiella ictaluri 93-146]AVZ80924.1 tRNA 2-selenouridine(34) synthase MnmH [Edwardsiella ictaluri]EKS7762329.1 tRNA 2-selenouridine(34) synthase MnmH [Edwardsiella ictaluri]EKS7769156.1 tRNA 2-selenouridine(34) synthase MnmH [Edwardsiella ictaluri]EKS7772305.1 tRNA 2-selenouridine(34) synthase MnmH [Edwardsiella ictaluri]
MTGKAVTRPDGTDYLSILANDIPLIDVRAPVEFQTGAFPGACNLPLMLDSEREAVGICYKQQGQDAAIALGNRLVHGEVRAARIAAWREQCQRHPGGYLYCFRGGLRSHIVQQWLRESGLDYPLIEGGYKALRHAILQFTEQASVLPMVLIGGNTGCGKTRMLRELRAGIDLEGAAHHRGSSFGRTVVAQGTQIDFENQLGIALLKKHCAGIRHWILEDEGRVIGSNHVPLCFYNQMLQAAVAVVDEPFEARLARLQEEYIDLMRVEYERAYGREAGWQAYAEYLHHGLFAIRRRLGLERYAELDAHLVRALQQQQAGRGSEGHLAWLVPLLHDYYDPMYGYQLEKKAARVVFRGDYRAVREYLLSLSQTYGD